MTTNEREFISQIESSGVDELATVLARPTVEQERALRVHLGEARYERMHRLALAQGQSRGARGTQGVIVVLHGIMGAELSTFDRPGHATQIWLRILGMAIGNLERLRLATDGRTDADARYDVRATGILKRNYGELLLALAQNWTVRAFWYDWRKDVDIAAADLRAKLAGWTDDATPVHMVAHSMGGLVARAFIKAYPDRWRSMWSAADNGRSGGRLIMLGTPNHGSFAIPQVMTGLESLVGKLSLVDIFHSKAQLLSIFNTFPGSYQMLPSPLVDPAFEPLYHAETYGDLRIPQQHLNAARAHHDALRDVVDTDRMLYVAGYNQPTFNGVHDFARVGQMDAYDVTLSGDGRVPHRLGHLSRNGLDVPTHYIEESHGNLASNPRVLSALEDLLATGKTDQLPTTIPAGRGPESPSTSAQLRESIVAAQAADEARVRMQAQRLRMSNAVMDTGVRGDLRSVEESPYLDPTEGELADSITRGILSTDDLDAPRPGARQDQFENPPVEIAVVLGEIQSLDYNATRSSTGQPVDAIGVGHYRGLRPRTSELALDREISRALAARQSTAPDQLRALNSDQLLLTQYSARGTLTGEIGRPFFLPDPRDDAAETGRLIALGGMGVPGHFGVPELTVLVREMCWALGRLGKRHLASVLIGVGNGAISIEDAVSAWVRGLKYAVSGSASDERRYHLDRVTFVVRDPSRINRIQQALKREAAALAAENRLTVNIVEFDMTQLENKRRRNDDDTAERDSRDSKDDAPTLMTVEEGVEPNLYRVSAYTATASVPERDVRVDAALVEQANDEVAAERDLKQQVERGQLLGRLLIPDALRSELTSSTPLVLLLDSQTARVHWEMVAHDDSAPIESELGTADSDASSRFLGIGRGLTRRLRTTFAPPPEPPPPPRRVLRVLVVADPAEDAHLPGAELEGLDVTNLFAAFNRVWAESRTPNRVEVFSLLGPSMATRTNVLRYIMTRSFDILHFAGHCMFDAEDPSRSGWIFSNKQRLSANELSRIDRVPKFVFSNACESGVLPSRPDRRSVALAPSFAEAFFNQGVANFVCTAWPVDDTAARTFALTLYGALLGLAAGGDPAHYVPATPRPMHEAMQVARRAIARETTDSRTWGAYQHYGDPYLRFFSPDEMPLPKPKTD